MKLILALITCLLFSCKPKDITPCYDCAFFKVLTYANQNLMTEEGNFTECDVPIKDLLAKYNYNRFDGKLQIVMVTQCKFRKQ